MWSTLLNNVLGHFIAVGRLTVTGPLKNARATFGEGGGPDITIHLKDPSLPRKLVLNPELALGEAYMDGRLVIEGDDLHGLLELLVRNRENGTDHWFVRIQKRADTALRTLMQYNPLHRARANVAHHYDLSDALYALFLDGDRQYSCAYFRTPEMTLADAQEAKKHHIARKLLLKPGMRVLDVGCGWGGMALTLARDYGAEVVGVTLSREQHCVATRRAAEAGLSDRVEFRLQDYRKVNERFDRVVSVGMFEHVGVPHYREYFETLRTRLTEDGVALIHTIGREEGPGVTSPWIRKYIFPGGYIPALSEVVTQIERSRLWTTDVEVWRLHYAETLRQWYDRFSERIDEAEALYDARFCRMWKYYLAASEQSFRHHRHVVYQFQLAAARETVPLTRDYLYPAKVQASLAAE